MLVAWSATRSRLRATRSASSAWRTIFRPVIHRLHQLDEGIVAHAVDDIVHFEDCLRKFDLPFDERLQRAPHHGADRGPHAGDVHRQIGGGKFDHVHDALGDVDRLVSYALEVGIDLGDGENEAQVDGHGLLHGEQVERRLVDFALGGIDQALAFEHHLAASKIALDIRLAGAIDGLLRESSHAKQPLPQIVQPLLKARAH